MFRRTAAVALLAVVAAFLAVAGAAASAPPTLDGQWFNNDDVPITSMHCEPDGTSTVTYDASEGFPNGDFYPSPTDPYPGTMMDRGVFKVGPQSGTPYPSGPVKMIVGTFAIHSVVGDVTGTKRLLTPETATGGHTGLCQGKDVKDAECVGYGNYYPFPECLGYGGGWLPLRYEARIRTADGVYLDHGTVWSSITPRADEAITQPFLTDHWVSDLAAPIKIG